MAETIDRAKLDLDGTEAENLATYLEGLSFKGIAPKDTRLARARDGEAYKALRTAFEARDGASLANFQAALTPDAQGASPAGDAAAAIHRDFADAMARATRREGVSGALDYLEGADTKPFFEAAGFGDLGPAIRDGVFAPEKKRAGLLLWLLPLLLLGGAGLGGTAYLMRDKPADDDTLVRVTSTPRETAPAAELVPAAPVEPVAAPEPEIVVTEALPPPPAPPPKKPLFGSANWQETARFDGKDGEGRPARFVAYVLTSDESWAFARHDALRIEGEDLTYPLSATFEGAPFAEGFCDLSAMVTVGAASHEGAESLNATLASDRAAAVNEAIRAAAPVCEKPPKDMTLLLGRHRTAVACPEADLPCPELTAHQRPFALIAIEQDDPSTDVQAALKDGLSAFEAGGGSVLPRVKLTEYSELTIR